MYKNIFKKGVELLATLFVFCLKSYQWVPEVYQSTFEGYLRAENSKEPTNEIPLLMQEMN